MSTCVDRLQEVSGGCNAISLLEGVHSSLLFVSAYIHVYERGVGCVWMESFVCVCLCVHMCVCVGARKREMCVTHREKKLMY